MTSLRMCTARRATTAAALVALVTTPPLVASSTASADVPPYTCGTPTVYNVNTPGDIGGIATGNLNHDGHPDVATANLASSSSVFLNNGDGTLGPPTNYSLADSHSTADGAGSPVVADFNHDGNLDLVTANFYGQSISVLLGKGDGTFAPAVTYAPGRSPLQVVAGDFNGDGNIDLIALTFTQSYSLPAASLLLGKGDGSFQPPRAVSLPSTAELLVAGDFNGDGLPDLATANNNNSTYSVSVLLNKGHGQFAKPISYPVGRGPSGLAEGDLNGDGHPDLVTANSNDNTFSVLLNKGDGSGTFNPATSYAGSGGQEDTIIADMNGDRHPDIVAANPWGTNVMVLLNQGNGTFGTPTDCPNAPTGSDTRGPIHLAAADFNNDGKLDLVTANLASPNNNATPSISTLISP